MNSSNNGTWDLNFLPVMRFIDLKGVCSRPWKLLEAHPDYDAAKNKEDRTAALHLVHCFLNSPENHTQLETLKQKFQCAIIVPVHALEASGKNRIPKILAEYIGSFCNLDVDDKIVQTNSVQLTGTDEWHRFAYRPTFGGDVKPGQKYILVYDVFKEPG